MAHPDQHPGDSNEKSFFATENPRVTYCTENSVRALPIQKRIQEETLASIPMARMLGAPEVLQLCHDLIQLTHGKRCIDIGTFTGASALTWALAVPAEGEVYTLDIDHSNFEKVGAKVLDEHPELKKKVHPMLGNGVQSLDSLIADGNTGKFDFAFIDAAKTEYPEYYERCLTLLRPGGIIAIDNALQGNRVLKEEFTKEGPGRIVDQLNKFIHADERVSSNLLSMADGLHLAFKK